MTCKLWCTEWAHLWIAAELEWKSIEPLKCVEPSGQTVETASTKRGPRLLGRLALQITLVKRVLPQLEKYHPGGNNFVGSERGLTDDAFRPKSYTITIEKGNFIQPCFTGPHSSHYESFKSCRYALRLLFDKSPYPPRSEWKDPEGGPDSAKFWNITEFVSRSSPELKRQRRAMNDVPVADWDYCTVS
jgi:hypothetical protein